MLDLVLTQNSFFIIGPVAKLLGFIMQGIFFLLDKIGIPNIGLAIIIFTIVIYLCLLPLTIKQQKFSKFSAIMNPELTAIQNKYKGKNDQDSMMKMQEETKAVYAKYGVSPSGSCLQLLIQMPILFALYRVIYAIPAYVPQVKAAYTTLINKLVYMNGSAEFMQTLSSAKYFSKQFNNKNFTYETAEGIQYISNTFIDVLNRASTKDWVALRERFSILGEDISNTIATLNRYNLFLGLNIAYSPWETIKLQWASDYKNWWIIIAAVMVPVLAAATQWLNLKLTPQASNPNGGNDQDNPMMSSMKMMNNLMPLMSAFFCFTLPIGMGIYWIAGAVIRSIQQVAINKYIDSMDFDKIIEKNSKKYEEKLKKKGTLTSGISQKINAAANSGNNGTKEKSTVKDIIKHSEDISKEEKTKPAQTSKKSESSPSSGKGKPGGEKKSLADRVNMVKDYNERNNK